MPDYYEDEPQAQAFGEYWACAYAGRKEITKLMQILDRYDAAAWYLFQPL